MSHADFDLSGHAIEPFFLEKASPSGRDIVFEGAVLAEVHCGPYQYRLYGVSRLDDKHSLVVAKMRLQDGKVTAEIITPNDTDVLEEFYTQPSDTDLGLNVLHEICRQSRFPGYDVVGIWHEEKA